MDGVNYEEIWEACQKERQTNQLLLIQKTFYEDALRFVGTLEDTTATTNQTTKTNALKILSDLFDRRKQKILIYVAYNKPLPQPISNREAEFYNKIMEESRTERLDRGSATEKKFVELRSVKDIPAIVLPSGDKAGPFVKGHIIEVKNSEDNISFLVNNLICEHI